MSGAKKTQTLAERLARAYTGAAYDVLRGRGIRDTILPKKYGKY